MEGLCQNHCGFLYGEIPEARRCLRLCRTLLLYRRRRNQLQRMGVYPYRHKAFDAESALLKNQHLTRDQRRMESKSRIRLLYPDKYHQELQ